MEKVIGIEKKTGQYQGHDYENIVIHCELPEPANIAGKITKSYKFKARDQKDILGDITLSALLGKGIEVYFNGFQQVKKIEVK